MIRPEAVVFDLGKVLLDFDYAIAAKNLASHSGSKAEVIHKFINQSPLLFRYETGLMTTDEFFEEFRAETKFSGTAERFAELFGNIFTPMEPMIALHARLKQSKIPTFIFSNTNELGIRHIRGAHPFFAGFDGYIFSYEHGAMKPHTKLYEVVERITNRHGSQIVYIDDRPENIEAGAGRGWQVVLQESPEKTMAALSALGLPAN
ncbi:MAG TPA: HAD family phosphatase [Verrucomicrobiae bacterium]|jgi:putative hydrolase of the HAD superfamily|nr:HAD family phosphatase [Verrucomicrobiae bacterium]